MSRARIINGRWRRHVPGTWENDSGWRTGIFKSVLADPRLREAEFILDDGPRYGPRVAIPTAELQRVLVGGRDRYDGQIWGPFNIDPIHRTVDGQAVQMEVIV